MPRPKPNEQPLRAASYHRVSTTSQATDGLSLGAQQHRTAKYIADQGWKHVGSYTDAGVSGRRASRPELDRLLADLDSIDVLVIPKFDRLGRSSRHMLEVYDRLEAAGVRLISLSENIDTSTAAGRFMRTLLSANAELESENIGERVRSVQGVRARSGKHHGRPPYGYEPRDGVIVPVPHEAAIVKRVFYAFLAGQSQRQITRDLIEDGIPAPRTNWHQGTISQILRNETYAGRVRFNGEVFEGRHEPIIEPAKFDEAAQLLEASARTKGWRGKQPARHLFTRVSFEVLPLWRVNGPSLGPRQLHVLRPPTPWRGLLRAEARQARSH